MSWKELHRLVLGGVLLSQMVVVRAEEGVWKESKAMLFLLSNRLEPVMVEGKKEDRVDIFCYKGDWQPLSQRVFKLWTTANLKLAITSDDYQLFHGHNESHVYQNFMDTSTSIVIWTLPWRTDNIQLSPFNKTCIGILTKHNYAVRFIIKVLDPWLLSYFIIGSILFFSAPKLSRNVIFFYGMGMTVGVLASLLILVFIFSRFIPFKKGVYGVLIAGWSVVLWCFRNMWEHYHSVLESFWQYIMAYILVAGTLSLLYCYWKGPVTDTRSLNIIKWTIQFIGLAFIYNSTQIQEVSVALILLIITLHYFPHSCIGLSKRIWRRFVPKRLRFLTEEEYLLQGNIETQKALEELRDYCKSPDCDAWKVISRLTSPQRFAKWVEGDTLHLSDDELMSFEEDPGPLHYTPEISEDELDFRLSSQ